MKNKKTPKIGAQALGKNIHVSAIKMRRILNQI